MKVVGQCKWESTRALLEVVGCPERQLALFLMAER